MNKDAFASRTALAGLRPRATTCLGLAALIACAGCTKDDRTSWQVDQARRAEMFNNCLEKAKVSSTVSDDDNAEVVTACSDTAYYLSLYRPDKGKDWLRDSRSKPEGPKPAAERGSVHESGGAEGNRPETVSRNRPEGGEE